MRPRLACPGCDAARALASGASLIRDRHRRGALFSPVVYRKAGAFVARMSAGEIRGIPRLASLMRATRFACGRSRLHCYSLILTMENTNPGVRAVRVRPPVRAARGAAPAPMHVPLGFTPGSGAGMNASRGDRIGQDRQPEWEGNGSGGHHEIADHCQHGQSQRNQEHQLARCMKVELHFLLPFPPGGLPNRLSTAELSAKAGMTKPPLVGWAGALLPSSARVSSAPPIYGLPSSRRTLVISLPAARMRAIACSIGSNATAMWKALA